MVILFEFYAICRAGAVEVVRCDATLKRIYDVCRIRAARRIELLPDLQEQSLSIDYHRYGNLAGREGERRGRVT